MKKRSKKKYEASTVIGIAFVMLTATITVVSADCLNQIDAIIQPGGCGGGGGSNTRTWYVDDDGGGPDEDGSAAHPFDMIQEGVNMASPGDTVKVLSGDYFEQVVISLDHSTIQLIGSGSGSTRIYHYQSPLISISAEKVQIKQFEIDGTIELLDDAELITIENNVIDTSGTNDNGIEVLGGGGKNRIMNNNILSGAADGIYINDYWGSRTNEIRGNTISGGAVGNGIYLFNGYENKIIDNTIEHFDYGIRMDGDPEIHWHTFDNKISENEIIWCYEWAIYLSGSMADNEIHSNFIHANFHGVWLSGSGAYNGVWNNYFDNSNGNAKDDLVGVSYGNYWNVEPSPGPNIIGGPQIGGNFWDDYAGSDSNGDGFGDVPYSIPGSAWSSDNLPLVSVKNYLFEAI
jgi:parallel beta-helix repeat protein